jgi:long-chain fatty acid transport protein
MNFSSRFLFSVGFLSLASILSATNGDNLIAIGPSARGMGGLSVANPQDAISAVFGNPAAMCYSRYCPSSQVDFAGTVFAPHIDAKVSSPMTGSTQLATADSDEKIYPIPAIGISIPYRRGSDEWRFGLAAYGVTGLGVDYRETAIDIPNYFGPGASLVAGEYTSLQIMKFAPAIAYQAADNFSIGAGFHLDYATLDLGNGSSPAFGAGAQLGMVWRPSPKISIGLTYVSAQQATHDDVVAMATPTGGMARFDFTLEAPQQFAVGISWETMDHRLVSGVEVKWVNWADAKGYSDFDWNNQTVIALGLQYEVVRDKFFIRVGYNYGENPVEEHQGWNGAFTPTGPAEVIEVQGILFPRYYYETFRIIGFPAIVEHHLTVGFTIALGKSTELSVAYLRALEETITENGIGPAGTPTILQSTLSEDSLEVGFAWRF